MRQSIIKKLYKESTDRRNKDYTDMKHAAEAAKILLRQDDLPSIDCLCDLPDETMDANTRMQLAFKYRHDWSQMDKYIAATAALCEMYLRRKAAISKREMRYREKGRQRNLILEGGKQYE